MSKINGGPDAYKQSIAESSDFGTFIGKDNDDNETLDSN